MADLVIKAIVKEKLSVSVDAGYVVLAQDATVKNSDDTYIATAPAGGVLELPDIEVTVNGVSQGTFPSVQDIDITVTRPTVTLYNRCQQPKTIFSVVTGDVFWQDAQGLFDNWNGFQTPDVNFRLQVLDTNDVTGMTLMYNNIFGNKRRITALDGTENLDLNDYFIDHYTGYRMPCNQNTFDGLADTFINAHNYVRTLIDSEGNQDYYIPPFGVWNDLQAGGFTGGAASGFWQNVPSPINQREFRDIWTSSPYSATTLMGNARMYAYGYVAQRDPSLTSRFFPMAYLPQPTTPNPE